jgi:hypothetical protein
MSGCSLSLLVVPSKRAGTAFHLGRAGVDR